ncbi:DNA phosphorothioation-dependent restriction protein DptF [Halobacillus salinus]|uniref:DNA phosphorothioation-dependent restriction protein DptF n=1 Tax=Halobacillus salinus TaxID=192814 RepID=UPI0009A862B7|nr:DNA phosphorothioation-dependent restriction protein DptF [Halobacillus salinus]
MTVTPFCSFLEGYDNALFNLAKKVDELVYVDATSAVVQGRKFAENLLQEIYKEEKKDPNGSFPKLYDMLHILYRDGVIDRKLQKDIDFLRFHGNRAAHDSSENSQIVALKVHRKVFVLAGWYTEVYCSPDFETPEYEEPKPSKGMSEDYIQELILQHINQFKTEIPNASTETSTSDKNFNIEEDLEEGESYLLRELGRLKASSQEALENVGNFSEFKNYLHVNRNIQVNLENALERSKDSKKKLIVLSGSVGDGKSHLLSYLTENKPELINGYTIINDATESISPDKNSLETLRDKLSNFSDQHLQDGEQKIILAINLGVLNNFMSHEHENVTFEKFKEFIDQSHLFSDEITEVFDRNEFSIINFSDYQPFQLRENKVFSKYFDEIFNKVTNDSQENPFYQAYLKDLERNCYTAIHLNYEFLSDELTKHLLNKLVCHLILEDKIVVSTRTFLNFIADLLIPSETRIQDLRIENMTEFERVEYSLPSLLFDRQGRSELIDRIQKYDPIHKRSKSLDEIINSLYSTQDFSKVTNSYINNDSYNKIFNPFANLLESDENNLEEESFESLTKLFIRAAYLTDAILQEELEDPSMKGYVRYLYGFNKFDPGLIRDVYDTVRKAIFAWKGSPKKGYVYINDMSESYRVAQKIDFNPSHAPKNKSIEDELETFNTTIQLAFVDQFKTKRTELEIDYPLYKLLSKVNKGYRPSKKDYEDGLAFTTFMDQLISMSKGSDLLIHYHGEKELYVLDKDFVGSYAFEKVEG